MGFKSEQKRVAERKVNLEKLFMVYEGNCEANVCTLRPEQMRRAKDWFMSKKWKIFFRTANGSFSDQASVTLKGIEDKHQFSYTIRMSMLDSVGGSEATGILVHQADYLSIFF